MELAHASALKGQWGSFSSARPDFSKVLVVVQKCPNAVTLSTFKQGYRGFSSLRKTHLRQQLSGNHSARRQCTAPHKQKTALSCKRPCEKHIRLLQSSCFEPSHSYGGKGNLLQCEEMLRCSKSEAKAQYKQPRLEVLCKAFCIEPETRRRLLANILSAILSLQAPAAIAQGLPCEDLTAYYKSIAGLEGPVLKKELHKIIKDAKAYSYAQVWDALKILDATDAANPEASTNVNDIYSRRTFPKAAQALPDGWNREHLWPQSYGLPLKKPEHNDLHNLRPADVNVNSARGNKPYGECNHSSDASCLVPANKEAGSDTATNRQIWTPPTEVRGDIARALFYMTVRYEGEEPGSKDLELSDQPSVEKAQMGRLSDLLRWHAADPPSAVEKLRNDRVCSRFQHNRNPFVDKPELVDAIWGRGTAPSRAGSSLTPGAETSAPPPKRIATSRVQQGAAWVNEFHYNNTGKDEDEFVEIAISRGVDPVSVVVHLYNGANGSVYRTLPLSNQALFQKGKETSDGATLYFARVPEGLQNGPSDGIAVTIGDRVVDFVSYEGSFTAESGPAKGLTARDVKVSESNRTPIGSSVGLVDRLKNLWSRFAKATPGFDNS